MKSQNFALESFPVSETSPACKRLRRLKAAQTAANLREQGFDVIDLTVGEPDFQTPEFIKEFGDRRLAKRLDEIHADRRA